MSTASLRLPRVAAQSAAKYTRYNVTSPGGKTALASYAKGIEAMLKLPATDPQNWFRNAFLHLMDCPHGNWWFYVWHRGYVGYIEQTIRRLSGDSTFAMPYWDWTTQPQIPDSMFDGVLTPAHQAFEPYTRNLADFTAFIRPALASYWNSLNAQQLAQLKTRGYPDLETLWNDVTGYDPHQMPPHGISGNIAYANPDGSRYLTRGNPKLDEKTAYNVTPFVIYAGLLPTDFYNQNSTLSFNSSKTPSHHTAPGGKGVFSVLEGMPHNKVHNYIGGVGPLDPGPYGCMTNFLSPVDPIFFLHHANIDRLWDVWTRKQKRLNLPYLPTGADLDMLANEPFLFYVDGDGKYVGNARAGDYFGMDKFGYEYEPGFGEDIVSSPTSTAPAPVNAPMVGSVKGNTADVPVPAAAIRSHLAAPRPSLVAEVTLQRPSSASSVREFDVLINAPANVTRVDAQSRYYAGTIAFFGAMMNMSGGSADATFLVPLPRRSEAFAALGVESTANVAVTIRVVPSQGRGSAPPIRAVTVRAR